MSCVPCSLAVTVAAANCTPCSCDKKLLKLVWQEKTSWEEGLRKTGGLYLANASRDYRCVGCIAAAIVSLLLRPPLLASDQLQAFVHERLVGSLAQP